MKIALAMIAILIDNLNVQICQEIKSVQTYLERSGLAENAYIWWETNYL